MDSDACRGPEPARVGQRPRRYLRLGMSTATKRCCIASAAGSCSTPPGATSSSAWETRWSSRRTPRARQRSARRACAASRARRRWLPADTLVRRWAWPQSAKRAVTPRRGMLPPDAELVARLRGGDEAAFAALLDSWSRGMLRAARAYVASDEAAEDVVQETWLAVIRGIDRFEGRSSLRTWAYRILVNIAKDPRCQGQPHRCVVEPGSGGLRANGRPQPLPGTRRSRARSLAPVSRGLAVGGDRGGLRRGPARHRGGARRSAAPATGGDHAAGRRGVQLRGGLLHPGDQRGEPAGPAPPRPGRRTQPARGVLRHLAEHGGGTA